MPSLSPLGTLSLYFFGCEDGFEDSYSDGFSHLFQLLKATLYPDLSKLSILISGDKLGTSTPISTEEYYIRFRSDRAENIIPSLTAHNSLAVLLQPGFSVYIDSWEPALRLLVEGNFTTLVTGYSFVGQRLTTDSVFDERTLSSYFLADVVVPTTSNPASYYTGQFRKMAYYMVFQGRRLDPLAVPVSRLQLQADNHKAFVTDLVYVTAEFDRMPTISKRCEQILKLIDSGLTPFAPMASMADVDNYLMYGHV